MTNLRLPGQYDERLLGSVGLQGPYYNWNRWYLPGVGRYLELDPIAKAGGFNSEYGIDWYNYANGNPLRYADPSGRAVPVLVAIGAAGDLVLDLMFGWWGVACLLDDKLCGPLKPPPPPQPEPSPSPAPAPNPGDCDPKDDCYEQWKKCAEGPLGGMRAGGYPTTHFGYSQFDVCRDECIQTGKWPVRARNGKRCQ